MCERYALKNPVTKTSKLVNSVFQVEDNENYNAHSYQKLLSKTGQLVVDSDNDPYYSLAVDYGVKLKIFGK